MNNNRRHLPALPVVLKGMGLFDVYEHDITDMYKMKKMFVGLFLHVNPSVIQPKHRDLVKRDPWTRG